MDWLEIRQLIEGVPLLLLYYSTPTCSVCKTLKPRVRDLVAELPPWYYHYVDVSKDPELRGKGMIFNVPTLVLYVQGREVKRLSRHFGLSELAEPMKRYRELVAPS